ncbi:protocadherin fat 3-like protein [Lasius niger]|uniref:Protocadherin fat 3-like protein n=1 Tax=Lasius niger TaxID=67767 RepID=A0A0J7LAW5_LASNI|nr:protocadherin fat 3-like protein [Lasius niger]
MTHWFWCLLCVILHLQDAHAKVGLCEVESGQSNIILDIEESRGNAIDQRTVPEELPVSGDPYNETMLELIFPGRAPLFKLNGKKLQLLEPLDRDDENLSHVVFQLSCTVKSTNKKRTIPVIVRVSDINDNAPKFINTPYETTVPELTPVGSTIFKNVDAFDADAGVNGIVEYSIAPGDGSRIGSSEGVGRNRITTADGYGYFSINLPHQGQVTVNRTLDYERTQRYLVTILASVSLDLVLITLIDRSCPELQMKVEIDQAIDSDVGAEIMTYTYTRNEAWLI